MPWEQKHDNARFLRPPCFRTCQHIMRERNIHTDTTALPQHMQRAFASQPTSKPFC